MGYWAFAMAVASVAYSYHNYTQAKRKAEKAKREAEAQADKAKGFQMVDEGDAATLAIPYGRSKLGGVRVHFHVASDYNYIAPGAGVRVFDCMRKVTGTRQIWELYNTATDWTGDWLIRVSELGDFSVTPSWVCTNNSGNWSASTRAWVGFTGFSFQRISLGVSGFVYEAPDMNFIFCKLKGGTDATVKPPISLQDIPFEFPIIVGTIPVMTTGYLGGSKNEFFYVQQAISVGGLAGVHFMDLDEKPYTYDPYTFGACVMVDPNGGIPNATLTAKDDTRANARFTGTAFATGIFRLNRDDPQFNGTPMMQFYVEGLRSHTVERAGSVYSLSATKTYSNNSARVLLDYLMDPGYGKGIELADIDLESFYKAIRVCDTVVATDLPRVGNLWQGKNTQKDLILFECNLALDSGDSFRANISKILNTMGLATLVWSDGKYRLNLAYAELFNELKTYPVDSVVQVTIGSRNKLYRATTSVLGLMPGPGLAQWAEDVIPDNLKDINDDYLLRDTEVVVSWPSADTKLNFATVRFLDENKNFSENTASWPNKRPTVASGDTVYAAFLEEDSGVPLESESFEDGCTTLQHALARAEQRVRASRGSISYSFDADVRLFCLEPGDVFGYSSEMFSIPYTLLKVDDIATEQGGIIKVKASTFDAGLLAWNVSDTALPDVVDGYVTFSIGQAENLAISIAGSDTAVSNYALSWDRPADNRAARFTVRYTSEPMGNIDSNTAWTEVGSTSGLSMDLPSLNGTYTFTVVASTANGRSAPFRNIGEGSEWPMLSLEMSASFLDSLGSIVASLSNDEFTFNTDVSGTILSGGYAGSGTEIGCFVGNTALIYDGVGTTNGTWKVTTIPGEVSGITVGAISADPTDSQFAVVAAHSAMISDTATITYRISGTTPTGASFLIKKRQSFRKLSGLAGQDAVYYYIDTNANVITKASPSVTVAGAYSTPTFSGKKVTGSVISAYGFVTATPNGGTEAATAVASLTTTLQPTDNVSSVTVRLYGDANKTTLRDTEIIPVIFRGATGNNAISGHLGTVSQTIPCTASGDPISYLKTGTNIYVYEGSTRLVYDATSTANGFWKVTASPSNITTSPIMVDEGDYVRFGDHSAIMADTAAIVYTIQGKSLSGTVFELQLTQTFTKVLRGANALLLTQSRPNVVFATDYSGTIASYVNTGNLLTVMEGTTPLRYDDVGTSPGRWRVTAVGTGVNPSNIIDVVSVNNAEYRTVTNMTADAASIVFTVVGKTLSGGDFTLTTTQTFVKQKSGDSGTKTALLNLYQWANSQPAPPTGSSVATWNPLSPGVYTKAVGQTDLWDASVLPNPGNPGIKLWTATKPVSAVGSATTSGVDWTSGVSVFAISQNGLDGQGGESGMQSATAVCYRYSHTLPASPSGTSQYSWATGSIDALGSANLLAGWSSDIPDLVKGSTLWAARVKLLDSATVATSTADWGTSSISALSYSGSDGLGEAGSAGLSYVTAYAKSSVASATSGSYTTSGISSVPPNASFGLSDSVWSKTVPTLSAGEYLYKADGTYNAATGQASWSAAYWNSLKVGSLSAISANLGSMTSGDITVSDTGFVRGGQSSYGAGDGFWLGYAGDGYKFSIGNATKYLKFDGENLQLSCVLTADAVDAVSTINLKNQSVIVPGSGQVMGAVRAGDAWVELLRVSMALDSTFTSNPSSRLSILASSRLRLPIINVSGWGSLYQYPGRLRIARERVGDSGDVVLDTYLTRNPPASSGANITDSSTIQLVIPLIDSPTAPGTYIYKLLFCGSEDGATYGDYDYFGALGPANAFGTVEATKTVMTILGSTGK